MWWTLFLFSLLLLGVVLVKSIQTLRSPYEGSAIERRGTTQISIVASSWLLIGAIAGYQGGTALYGIVEDGRFLVRYNPASVGVEVSALHWLASLVVESVVLGLGPLLIILIVRSIHGVLFSVWFTRIAVAFGILWALGIGLNAALGIAQWLEAVGS